jgi:hypothetical protein
MSRVANACGFLFAHQPPRTGHGPDLAAECLFFVEVFGLSTIAIGGAMLLGAACPHRTRPIEVNIGADLLAAANDPYLQMFAAGPGCEWYIPPGAVGNVSSCDGQRNAPSADWAGE